MRKLFTLLMVASMFGLVACGPSAEENAADAADADAMANEMFETAEDAMEEVVAEVTELAEHVCDATCEEGECTGPRCGEAGHECSDACHAEGEEHAEEGEEHVHVEGEEHAH